MLSRFDLEVASTCFLSLSDCGEGVLVPFVPELADITCPPVLGGVLGGFV